MTLGSPVQLAIETSAGVISELCSAQDDGMRIIVSLAVTSYKGKFHPMKCHKAQRGNTSIILFSLTSALDGGEWSKPHPGRFTP